MTNPKYWLVSAIDNDAVKCVSYETAVDLAVAVREIIDGYMQSYVFIYCFYGDRLPIASGPVIRRPAERYLVVPHHSPSHYPLFGQTGEMPTIEADNGLVCAGPTDNIQQDAGYKEITDDEIFDDDEDENDLLTEHENIEQET